jgi:hypothetical protein
LEPLQTGCRDGAYQPAQAAFCEGEQLEEVVGKKITLEPDFNLVE